MWIQPSDPGGRGHAGSRRVVLHLAAGVRALKRALSHHQPQRHPGTRSTRGPSVSNWKREKSQRGETSAAGKRGAGRVVPCSGRKSSLLNHRQGSNARQDSGSECCLSLCQAVSFLPAAEEDEEIMVRKEDGSGRGMDIWPSKISVSVGTNASLGNALSFSVSGEQSPGRGKTLAVLTVSDFECPLCIRSEWLPC